MTEEVKKEVKYHPADTNGDGKVSKREEELYLKFKSHFVMERQNFPFIFLFNS